MSRQGGPNDYNYSPSGSNNSSWSTNVNNNNNSYNNSTTKNGQAENNLRDIRDSLGPPRGLYFSAGASSSSSGNQQQQQQQINYNTNNQQQQTISSPTSYCNQQNQQSNSNFIASTSSPTTPNGQQNQNQNQPTRVVDPSSSSGNNASGGGGKSFRPDRKEALIKIKQSLLPFDNNYFLPAGNTDTLSSESSSGTTGSGDFQHETSMLDVLVQMGFDKVIIRFFITVCSGLLSSFVN